MHYIDALSAILLCVQYSYFLQHTEEVTERASENQNLSSAVQLPPPIDFTTPTKDMQDTAFLLTSVKHESSLLKIQSTTESDLHTSFLFSTPSLDTHDHLLNFSTPTLDSDCKPAMDVTSNPESPVIENQARLLMQDTEYESQIVNVSTRTTDDDSTDMYSTNDSIKLSTPTRITYYQLFMKFLKPNHDMISNEQSSIDTTGYCSTIQFATPTHDSTYQHSFLDFSTPDEKGILSEY